MGGLIDIRVKAGTPIHLEVPFEGEPQPTVTWKQNDVTVPSEGRKDITIKENYTELHILSSQRGDSGTYSLTLQNEFGKDTGSCHVTVLGK